MKCKYCQNDIMTNLSKSCPQCGAEGDYIDRSTVTKNDFFKYIAPKSTKQGITIASIVVYIAAFFLIVYGIIAGIATAMDRSGDNAMVYLIVYIAITAISAAFFIVPGILIQTKRSRVAAVILLVYSAVNLGYTVINTGRSGGAALFGAGILAVVMTIKFHKQYEQYKRGEDINNSPSSAPVKPLEQEKKAEIEGGDYGYDKTTSLNTQFGEETPADTPYEEEKVTPAANMDISDLENIESDSLTENSSDGE